MFWLGMLAGACLATACIFGILWLGSLNDPRNH